MMYDRTKPYNDLPLLPQGEELMEDVDILKALISANRELAKVNGQLEKLPNPTMMINTLALQEARASTEIENIFTTDDELYRAISSEKKLVKIDSATKEVLRYRQALWTGFDDLKAKGAVTTEMIIDIYQTIKKVEDGLRPPQSLTIIRRGESDLRAGEIVYTPPRGEGVLEPMIANLVDYFNQEDGVDPLIKMAVSHYQFESIHPFTDGNGRTGRILNLLYLVQAGLLSQPNLYLSRQIITTKDEYYYQIAAVRQQNSFKRWVLYMLGVVERTSIHTSSTIDEILKQMDATLEYGKSKLPWYSKEVNEMLFTQPYSKAEHLATVIDRSSSTTIRKYLKQLMEARIISTTQNWKEVYYMNQDLIRILEG